MSKEASAERRLGIGGWACGRGRDHNPDRRGVAFGVPVLGVHPTKGLKQGLSCATTATPWGTRHAVNGLALRNVPRPREPRLITDPS
jgi:hypothetical protein